MYLSFYLCILSFIVPRTSSENFVEKISNIEWLCANENCSEPVGFAKPKHQYQGDHPLKVGFSAHDKVNILGKPLKKDEEFWLVSVNKKIGVVNQNLLKESGNPIVKAKDCISVRYNFHVSERFPPKPDINPSPALDVFDGTTIKYGLISDEEVSVTTDESTENTEGITAPENELNNLSTVNNDLSGKIAIAKGELDKTVDPPTSSEFGAVSKNQNVSAVNETLFDNLASNDSSQKFKQEIPSNENSKTEREVDPNDPTSFDISLQESNDSPQTENVLPSPDQLLDSTSQNETQEEGTTVPIPTSQVDSDLSPKRGPEVAESVTAAPDPSGINKESSSTLPNAENAAADKLIEESLTSDNTKNLDDLTEMPALNSSFNITNNSEDKSSLEDTLLPPSPPSSLAEEKSEHFYQGAPMDVTNSSETQTTPPLTEPVPSVALTEESPNYKYESSSPDLNSKDVKGEPSAFPVQTETFSPETVSSESITGQPPNYKYESSSPDLNSKDVKGEPSASSASTETVSSETVTGQPPNYKYEFSSPDLNSKEAKTGPSPLSMFSNQYPSVLADANNFSDLPIDATQPNISDSPAVTQPSVSDSPAVTQPSVSDSPAITQPSVSDSPAITQPSVSDSPAINQPNVSDSPSVESSSSAPSLNEGQNNVMLDNSYSNEPLKESTSAESSSVTLEVNTDKEYSSPGVAIVEKLQLSDVPPVEKSFQNENSVPSIENPVKIEEADDSSTNWFSPVFSVISSIKDMFSRSDIGVDDSQIIHEFSTISTHSTSPASSEEDATNEDQNKVCEKDQFCHSPPPSAPETPTAGENLPFSIPGLEGVSVSFSTFIYLTVTSSVVLMFSLGYYYLENLKRESVLVAKINSLSAELFFAQKELSTMEEQMSMTSENFQKLASNTSVNNEELIRMKEDLKENEAVKQGLELEIKRLEKEIESLVESNDEMHKMLTESITEEDRTQALLANIADLKSVLTDRLEEITTLTEQLDKEKQEVELLTIALQKAEEKKESLEEKLHKVMDEIDSKALAVTKEFEEKVSSLEKIIEDSSLERTNFEKQICELKAECEKLAAEKELAEKSLKKAQGLGPGKANTEWLDAKEVRVELIVAQKEVDKLRRQLEEAKEHEAKLQEQKGELQIEIETLNNNYETAEKNKIEALTKLQVLSNYFKEKETQLQEELGEKESQWLQKQSEDHTIYEQMRSLREENLSYRAQNEALKKEILDQEASFKIQIANEEQKSQEHWVSLRHTERRLKEAQMETAHLRNRLTALETNSDSLDEKHKSLELVDGEVTLGPGSPPFMLYPPPPHDFIPPPPLVSPSRPPPLGRLSSPPLTPPPPLSHFDLYPPPPSAPSPPTLRGVIKPQPRESHLNHRKQKESHSSNHSSESIEKPIRRGKR